jgi:hypothetical protein
MRDCRENGHHPANQKIVVCKYILTYNADVKKRGTGKYERQATDVRQKQIVDAAMRIIATRGSRRFTANFSGASEFLQTSVRG